MQYDSDFLRRYCHYVGRLGTFITVLLTLAGAVGGLFMGDAARLFLRVHGITPSVIGAIVCALAGFSWGYSRRVHAHQLLCQLEIEEHLRTIRETTAAQLQQPVSEPQ